MTEHRRDLAFTDTPADEVEHRAALRVAIDQAANRRRRFDDPWWAANLRRALDIIDAHEAAPAIVHLAGGEPVVVGPTDVLVLRVPASDPWEAAADLAESLTEALTDGPLHGRALVVYGIVVDRVPRKVPDDLVELCASPPPPPPPSPTTTSTASPRWSATATPPPPSAPSPPSYSPTATSPHPTRPPPQPSTPGARATPTL